MSFSSRNATIQAGDTVIAYVNPEAMKPLVVTAGQLFQNRFGTFHHDDMVGKQWGCRASCGCSCSTLETRNGKGFVYLIQPTPELWTLVLPHRTQILYNADISLISSFLELQPGVKAIEAGTGSGSFSHSIARTVAPDGHLFSFEYHEERVTKATEEFKVHGLSDLITVQHRDVCRDGFGIEHQVTAIFLDLPSPWEALENAKRAFDPNRIGRICCFSPCVEQVQRTCQELQRLEFYDIRMFEVLVRPYEVSRIEKVKLPMEGPTPKGSGKSFKRPAPMGEDDDQNKRLVYASKPTASVRGHTSFLDICDDASSRRW
eukprot:jgi/Hompol1/6418/HPOL_002261-RA